MRVPQPRPLERIVEDQARRWELRRHQHKEPLPRPVIAISRRHGAGGTEVARRLCRDLRLELYDREIIQQIAERARVSGRLTEALDEKDRGLVAEWLVSLTTPYSLSPVGYRCHLEAVIRAIAARGGAVILGRGAHLILGSTQAFRVSVVAPLESCVASIMQRDGVSEAEARCRVMEVETDRDAFIRRHFPESEREAAVFDLVVNAASLGVEGAVSTIESALSCSAAHAREEPAAWRGAVAQ
jgi:cytidylate kinase